jgi:hypothetical protein
MKRILAILAVVILLVLTIPASIAVAGDNEVLSLRTENSYTYALGGGQYRADFYTGPVNYKDNYADLAEAWKVIDLTWDGSLLDKAPYILTHDKGSYTVVDKKTGDSVTITPATIGGLAAKAGDVSVVPMMTGVRFPRTINNAGELAKTSAVFDIIQHGDSIKVSARAVDADGVEIPVDFNIADGKMTESIEAGKLAGVKYPVTIDPIISMSPTAGNQDGYAARFANGSWAAIRDGNGDAAQTTETQDTTAYLKAYTTNNTWDMLHVGMCFIDTSTLPDDAVLSSANFSLRGSSKSDGLGITPTLGLYNTTSTNSAIAIADYQARGSTLLSDTIFTYAGFSTTGYNAFPLNAAGLSEISKTGLTRLVTRFGFDVDNTPPAWVSGAASSFTVNYSEYAGTDHDPVLSVTYTTPSIVQTDAATGIGYTSVTLNGEVTDIGSETPNVWFYYGEADGGTDPVNWSSNISLGEQSGAFEYELTELSEDTTYYYNVYGVNAGGSDWGTSANFTTLETSVPSVTTGEASAVGIIVATLNGEVTALNGGTLDLRGFEWGSASGVYSANWTTSANTTGAYSHDLTTSGETTYYYRAIAHSDVGWGYGLEKSFTTAATPPPTSADILSIMIPITIGIMGAIGVVVTSVSGHMKDAVLMAAMTVFLIIFTIVLFGIVT